MSVEHSRTRSCDWCGSKEEYAEEDCTVYYNRWNRECLAPPQNNWAVLSFQEPGKDNRTFVDFCRWSCLEAFARERYQEAIKDLDDDSEDPDAT